MVAARDFAGRLEAASPELPAQLELGMEMAIGRPPTAVERDVLLTYAVTHGLANTCRVILNLNEFTFID